jgi:hypothetical protein
VIFFLKKSKETLHIYFPHQGTSLHDINMVHYMPIIAIMGQCLFDLFYACSNSLNGFKETLTNLNRIERTCIAHNAHRLFRENVHV